MSADTPSLVSVPIVSKFAEVFPIDLLAMPLDHDIEFCIDLDTGTRPIFIQPYHMAPAELTELKKQLQDLLSCVLMQEGKVIAYSLRQLKVYMVHRSLQHVFSQRDQNSRKHRWMELLKDYDMTILYHLGKTNVIANTLSRKALSTGSLAHLIMGERPLDMEVRCLANSMVRIDISDSGKLIQTGSKSVHFIPLQTTYNAEKLARIYIREVVRLHGVPIFIILDRGTQFTSHLWRTLLKELGTQLDLSSTFHPQTDGQSERTIQVSKDMSMKKGKFSQGFIGPFEILRHIGEVAYDLSLPPGLLGVHPVFHVSMLKKYHSDSTYIIHWDTVLFDQNLSFEKEPVAFLDRQVRKLRSKEIASVKEAVVEKGEHDKCKKDKTEEERTKEKSLDISPINHPKKPGGSVPKTPRSNPPQEIKDQELKEDLLNVQIDQVASEADLSPRQTRQMRNSKAKGGKKELVPPVKLLSKRLVASKQS
ncbi:uncharacterized protein LOC132639583 [Lycium barbarum]|uniref:uncharacterized protein LOC132639583 n=1 Tax=Lycium barbarum TaxID=112863 RepID=UPI00293E61CD|nr:uncharacterized protein LOC132639583 [Lycium barbarum]